MTRQLDQASLDALKQREGCRLTAYKDVGGTWTIAYGHTGDVTEGQVIDQHQADVLLEHDTQWACDCVEHSVNVPLTDNEFGALVSFAYNIGASAFESSTLLKKLNAGDYESVPSEMLRWVKVKGQRSEGLVNRRNSEGGQWVKGAYVTSAAITPDAPPSAWRAVIADWHNRLHTLGITTIIGGVTSAKLDAAGQKLQTFAAWPNLVAAGVALCVVGVIVGVLRREA